MENGEYWGIERRSEDRKTGRQAGRKAGKKEGKQAGIEGIRTTVESVQSRRRITYGREAENPIPSRGERTFSTGSGSDLQSRSITWRR
ncbi:MAG: hypothetical protein HKN33_08205 [Pyrinomonadaceae bacterium]|nr:hypothetical protein [Pyrinomonadaceae bacterium]